MATIAEELAKAAVTDSFLRNENPLSNGGKWTKPSWDTKIGLCTEAEGWHGETAFLGGTDGARWGTSNAATGGVYLFAAVTLVKYENPEPVERWWGVLACLPTEKQNGYRVRAEELTEGGTKYKLKLEKLVEGTPTVLGEAEVELAAEGSAVAVVVGVGKVYAYYRKEAASEWKQAVEKADATYSEGRPAIEIKGNYPRLKDFKAGTFELEAGAPGQIKPPPASATASEPTPAFVGLDEAPSAATGTTAMGVLEVVAGAPKSPTDHKRGLPLPFPSVLANPSRLGPARLSDADRKTLGLD